MRCRARPLRSLRAERTPLSSFGLDRLPSFPRKKASLLRLALMMVEARGVEPLSEDNATCASTGVVTVLMSP